MEHQITTGTHHVVLAEHSENWDSLLQRFLTFQAPSQRIFQERTATKNPVLSYYESKCDFKKRKEKLFFSDALDTETISASLQTSGMKTADVEAVSPSLNAQMSGITPSPPQGGGVPSSGRAGIPSQNWVQRAFFWGQRDLILCCFLQK